MPVEETRLASNSQNKLMVAFVVLRGMSCDKSNVRFLICKRKEEDCASELCRQVNFYKKLIARFLSKKKWAEKN